MGGEDHQNIGIKHELEKGNCKDRGGNNEKRIHREATHAAAQNAARENAASQPQGLGIDPAFPRKRC